MKSLKQGFTLIELLVVIAIIAILAAILFPVFAQAKLAAKKTAGGAQMKQIGTAANLYQSDYDDGLPTWGSVWTHRDNVSGTYIGALDIPENYWDFMLLPYVKSDVLVLRNPDGTINRRSYGGLWRAPGAENQPTQRSIVINQLLVWDITVGGTPLNWVADTNIANGRYRWPTQNEIDLPAETVFVADGGSDGRYEPPYFLNGYVDRWVNRAIPTRSAPWRYENGSNYVYTDSHAKFELGNKMYPNPGPNRAVATWTQADFARVRCAAAMWFASDRSSKTLIRTDAANRGFPCTQLN